jgi:hypothetical protein
MNKLEAKDIFIDFVMKSKNWNCNCNECALNKKFDTDKQIEIFKFLKENLLVDDFSVCSSRFLYACLKYRSGQIQNIIKYAQKITKMSDVFLDRGMGCPCDILPILAKYILAQNKLNIE